MSVISEKLNIINNAKNDMKTAIENKGVNVGDVSISDYASKINEISSGGADFEINSCRYLFYSGDRLNALNELLALCKNVTTMERMFDQCYAKLTELDLSNFDTSLVERVANMLYYCDGLKTLNLSNCDMGKVNATYNMVYRCSKLTNLIFADNMGKGFDKQQSNYSYHQIDLSSCTLLTHESLMNVINKLYDLNLTYDVANGGTLYTQQLVLGSTNMAKLSADEIAIATNKGWVVS